MSRVHSLNPQLSQSLQRLDVVGVVDELPTRPSQDGIPGEDRVFLLEEQTDAVLSVSGRVENAQCAVC